jgi:hypothetical protein
VLGGALCVVRREPGDTESNEAFWDRAWETARLSEGRLAQERMATDRVGKPLSPTAAIPWSSFAPVAEGRRAATARACFPGPGFPLRLAL